MYHVSFILIVTYRSFIHGQEWVILPVSGTGMQLSSQETRVNTRIAEPAEFPVCSHANCI